jgi:hypothetical protein
MKRLVVVFLALLCTVLAQLPMVNALAPKVQRCACCNDDPAGGCGQSDCALPPTPAPVLCANETPSTMVEVAARRGATLPRREAEKFYAAFVETVVSVAHSAPVSVTSPPAVPLFKAHCRFLI